MATAPGTPTNKSELLVSGFRTMLTHISELFTPDNASSLAYINGLPSQTGNTPHKPLDVLVELEKRGVFSHENVEPLIGLLTDLHRVDIINTCGVREYKERAEQARLIRGDSCSSMSTNSRQPSVDLPRSDSGLLRLRGGSEPTIAGSGMGWGTPDTSSSRLPQLQQLSSQASGTASPRAQCSTSSSEECLPLTLTPSEEAKADLILQLASDPQAVSLMREMVSKGEATSNGSAGDNNNVVSASNKLQSLNINRNDSTDSTDEIRTQTLASTSSQGDDVLSPPIEFRSLDPSKTFYQRQTSTTSIQTNEEMSSLSLAQAGAIGSLALSRETGNTSGYDSVQTSFTAHGAEHHHPQAPGSLTPSTDDPQSLPLSATSQPAQGNSDPASTTKAFSLPKPSSNQSSPDFDSTVEAIKLTWKVKRLNLCELICKHSTKDISKELKLSGGRQGTPRRSRSGCDPVKLTFRLYPYGFGRDEGSFMSMRVCVRVDPRMYLKDMAVVHLKITTKLPPGEFITIRMASNSLEDFVLDDFIPHDIIINQGSKNVEFLIEAYLTYDYIKVDMLDTKAKELMDSITPLDEEEFTSLEDEGMMMSIHHTSKFIESCLPSAYYDKAVTKAHIPFMHHTILECYHSGLEYILEDHDITLIIPEGSVATNQMIHIEMGVTMYGQFIFPKNFQPISPIVWLCLLKKDSKLKKPFRLVLPHSLIGLSKDKLCNHKVGFAKASHHNCTIENGEMKYAFNTCDSKPLFASCGNNGYAVTELEHCCFYCLQANRTPELARDVGYCLTRAERLVTPQRSEIYFIATYFLKTCIQALKEQFQTDDEYKISRHDHFKFEDKMTPHIKFISSNNDQHVIALEPSTAQIRAADIDFWSTPFKEMKLKHETRMYPPRVKMTVVMSNTSPFRLSLKVAGCSSENQLDMDIALPLEAHSSSSGSQLHCHSHTIAIKGDKPKLKDAFEKLLPLAAHWNNIGILLGIKDNVLKEIKHNERQGLDCLREMLSVWLKIDNPPPTWNNLADTVKKFDPVIAEEIRNCIAE